MGIDGISFDEAWINHETRTFSDLTFKIISKDDLIKNKLASGRPQDLVDVENLRLTENPSN